MHSQARHSHPETRLTMLATSADDLAADPFMLSVFEDPVFRGDIAYEYLASEASGTSGSYLADWPVYSPLTGCAYTYFATPPLPMDGAPDSPTSPLSPPPQEPPSHQQSGKSPPKPRCRQGTPSYNHDCEKWSCSVCGDIFRERYECERHIENVGKQAMCLACGKTFCGRKDNRKRHYTKYCKRMDIGKYGDLRLEDAFIEV